MIKSFTCLSTALLSGMLCASAFAVPAMQSHGAMPVQLKLSNGQTKIVRLMNVTLSSNAAKQVAANITTLMSQKPTLQMGLDKGLPNKREDGMNGEPVLDQGEWGTCATFATTGAINALFDYTADARVSQLCNLEVGRTVGSGGDGGWQGSFGYLVMQQINKYGFMTLASQHQATCGGLKDYPATSADNGTAMPVADFAKYSQKTFTKNDWTPVLAYDGSFVPVDPKKAAAALHKVKVALNKGHRVVFGSLLDPYVGQAGATGSYDGIKQDTWVMTDKIKKDIASGIIAGHEIIIDGYDDKACATYQPESTDKTKPAPKPVKQCGLLRIRNSWGALAGDKGDYYMSYDHFKGMVVEAYALGKNIVK